MTKEQHINETELTEKLVDKITSYNRLNAFPNNDPSKVSEEDYDRLKNEYLSNFIKETKESFEKINSITDNYLALKLILETNHDIYNEAIEKHLAEICTPENIAEITKFSQAEEYQNKITLPRVKSLEIKQKSWTKRIKERASRTDEIQALL